MTQPRRLRAAIVGAGLMGRWHAASVVRAGHTISAIVDTDGSRAAALGRSYPNAAIASTLDAVDTADVVHVCAPLATHVTLCRDALTRGFHVVVEKPLAATVADTKTLLALAEASHRLIVPVHQFLYQRGVEQAFTVVRSIGPLLHVDFVICTAGAARVTGSERDRVVSEILPHPLSLTARLISTTIAGTDWQVRHSGAGELRADAVLEGATVSILISAAGRPTVNTMRLIGERGTVHVDLFHGFATVTRGRTTRAGKILQPFATSGSMLGSAATNLARRIANREPAYPGLRALISNVYAAVATGAASPISPDECLAVAIATEKIMGVLGARNASH